MTPVSITQSLSALHVEHAHLLEEHGADHAALHQREAVLADVQAREGDARATADSLPEREIGFLKALNVRLPLDYSVSLSSLES